MTIKSQLMNDLFLFNINKNRCTDGKYTRRVKIRRATVKAVDLLIEMGDYLVKYYARYAEQEKNLMTVLHDVTTQLFFVINDELINNTTQLSRSKMIEVRLPYVWRLGKLCGLDSIVTKAQFKLIYKFSDLFSWAGVLLTVHNNKYFEICRPYEQ